LRTLFAVLFGIAALFVFLAVASILNKRTARSVDGARWFIWSWLAATVIDFMVGVRAGHGAALELGVHALIFAVPAALAWYLRSRPRASPEGEKDVRPSSDE